MKFKPQVHMTLYGPNSAEKFISSKIFDNLCELTEVCEKFQNFFDCHQSAYSWTILLSENSASAIFNTFKCFS